MVGQDVIYSGVESCISLRTFYDFASAGTEWFTEIMSFLNRFIRYRFYAMCELALLTF